MSRQVSPRRVRPRRSCREPRAAAHAGNRPIRGTARAGLYRAGQPAVDANVLPGRHRPHPANRDSPPAPTPRRPCRTGPSAREPGESSASGRLSMNPGRMLFIRTLALANLLVREQLGEAGECGAEHAGGRKQRIGLEHRERRDVDDDPAAASAHVGRHEAGGRITLSRYAWTCQCRRKFQHGRAVPAD